MSDTIFGKIVSGEIPSEFLYEDEHCIAINDIHPQAPVHALIIPKEHIRTLNDLEPKHRELIGKLFLAAAEIAKNEGVDEHGYRVVMNCNEGAGQSVFHIHLHLLGGRALGWPPG